MKLLVTGGTGFIGSHLAEEGRRRGAAVVVLGLTDRPEEQANAALLRGAGRRGACRGASPMPELCARAMRASPTSFIWPWPCGRAARATSSSSESTSTAPAVCWRRPGRAGSSGSSTAAPSASTATGRRASPARSRPSAPGNIYERTKVAAEAMVREFGAAHGLPVVILRPADVYGPRDQRLLKLFRGVSRGRFPLFGRGDGRRHMVYVDDVVSAFFTACERQEAVGEGMIVAGPAIVHAAGADRDGAARGGSAAVRPPAAARADAGGGGGGRGRLPGAPCRPADLPAADGFLPERLGVRYLARAAAARLGPEGGAGGRRETHVRGLSSHRPPGGRIVTEPWQVAALPALAEEEGDGAGAAGATCRRPGPALSGAWLRYRPHVVLPSAARRDLGQRRLRAGPRPVGQAAGRRPCAPGGRADGTVPTRLFDLVAAISSTFVKVRPALAAKSEFWTALDAHSHEILEAVAATKEIAAGQLNDVFSALFHAQLDREANHFFSLFGPAAVAAVFIHRGPHPVNLRDRWIDASAARADLL